MQRDEVIGRERIWNECVLNVLPENSQGQGGPVEEAGLYIQVSCGNESQCHKASCHVNHTCEQQGCNIENRLFKTITRYTAFLEHDEQHDGRKRYGHFLRE